MASHSTPRIVTFKASGAIAKGKAVKFGSDSEHVSVCSAASDSIIGIAQSAATAAEDMIEVALPGGGGKALAGGSITRGALLTTNSDGEVVAASTAPNRLIALAMDSAADQDLVSVEIIAGVMAEASA